jgi:hypothetical protein
VLHEVAQAYSLQGSLGLGLPEEVVWYLDSGLHLACSVFSNRP